MARKAGGIARLFEQLNARFPNRSKASDGWIGDAAHAARASDHNPDRNGVVHAGDYTHDPRSGVDIDRLSDELVASQDPRIKYIICNGLFWERSNPRWVKYNGTNPHTKHLHLSVLPGIGDGRQDWKLPMLGATPAPQPPKETDDMFSEEDRKLLKSLVAAQNRELSASAHHGNDKDVPDGHSVSAHKYSQETLKGINDLKDLGNALLAAAGRIEELINREETQ